MKTAEFFLYLLKKLLNKYVITGLAFGAWIMFFDENNLIQHQKNKDELELLKEQVENYKHKISADQRKLHELQTNDENLEKFAREEFLMKKADEDIFVIIEE